MVTDPNAPGFVPASQVNTFYGSIIAPTISGMTPHSWVADANGLFHTTTDLKKEWIALHTRLLDGDTTLTAVQHAEANAETVFENTGLNALSEADQARDREDVQREFDAIGAAITKLGYSQKAPLTTQQYLSVERVVQSDITLQELAIQGHGVNSPPGMKYRGYTNDFQNNIDKKTLFIGAGLDHNENALTAFVDDVLITHASYAVVTQNGTLEQLNQNGNSEQVLSQAAGAFNDTFFLRTFQASEFSATPGTASAKPNLAITAGGTGAVNTMVTLFGDTISTTMSPLNGHVWMAGANGLFTTTTDLSAEWKANYLALQTGAANLTAMQRMEANAQAVFLNSGLAKTSESSQSVYRQDAQRVFDAIAGGMKAAGLDGKTALSQADYIKLSHAINNDPALLELYLQGYGVNTPSNARYAGYLNDFGSIDIKTLYVGGGSLDNGRRAVPDFFGDVILTKVGFGQTPRDGAAHQLDQNGAKSSTIEVAVDAFNASILSRVLRATDFNIAGSVPPGGTATPTGFTTSLFGFTIPDNVTANGHVWKVDGNGTFTTATDLQKEWVGYYKQMLAGNGATLTWFQRWEGNAEAVFENTSLAKQSATIQARNRQDLQRQVDAVVAEVNKLGIDFAKTGGVLSAADYLRLERGIQADPLLQELGIQGHGLNVPPLPKYNGYTNDFQNNVDRTTFYVGGGLGNGTNALASFFDDAIISHLFYQTVVDHGQLMQLNQNGDEEQALAVDVQAVNDTWFRRVYVASDFSTVSTAIGEVRFVSAANGALPEAAAPVAGAGQIVSLFGSIINGSITTATDGTAHNWTVDANGLFHTTADLAVEWYNLYQQALTNNGAGLTAIQRLEANAEAIFLNVSGFMYSSQAQLQVDREDIQRSIDATGAVMTKLGLSLTTPLTQQTYMQISQALQNTPNLLELSIQGTGVPSPASPRYSGFLNDFAGRVNSGERYVGPGLEAGSLAVYSLLNDTVVSKFAFPALARNAKLIQYDAAASQTATLREAVDAINNGMFNQLYTAKDFAIRAAQPVAPAPAGAATITTTDGTVILGSIGTNITPHAWVADAYGLFHTTTNLEIEWRGYYDRMLAGDTTLSGIQRLEGNAEAVFENTGVNSWGFQPTVAAAREDAQRQFDAMAAAAKIAHIDLTKPLTRADYITIDRTLQSNATLYELALQGHGLVKPPESRYRGYVNDLASSIDNTTLFIGGGFNNNQRALANFFGDNIMSNVLFSAAYQDQTLKQLNGNGVAMASLDVQVMALNDAMFYRTYTNVDFSKATSTANNAYVSAGQAAYNASLVAPVPTGTVRTMFWDVISNTVTIDTGLTAAHRWTTDMNGLFHTNTNLGREWTGYLQTVMNGKGATLTAIQRMEANAEVVFENTKISSVLTSNPALAQKYREDVQRCLDAMAGAMKIDSQTLGLDNTKMSTAAMIKLDRTIWSSAVLDELYLQGHGVNYPTNSIYRGYQGDFATGVDTTTTYVGGSTDNGRVALGDFFNDIILGNAGFGVVWRAGEWWQLDQNGNYGAVINAARNNLNKTAFEKTFTSSDFKR